MAESSADASIVVVADPAAASLEAASRVAVALAAADAERARADWATTGGSTVVGIYRALTETALMERVPWSRLHVWWGDDRYVPRDHPLSNAKPFDDIVAGIAEGEEGTAGGGWPGEPLPFDQIHPFRAGEAIATARGQDWCASAMADELRAVGPATNDEGWPVFDVLLLGVGARRAHPVGLPGIAGPRIHRPGDGHPGPDPRRAARPTGDPEPGRRPRRACGDRRRHGRGQGAGPR